jgi:UDP-N-acetylmuramoyl-L-alanyl-D-glutamate--2,6-diaminopimelate ligase
MRLEYLSKIMQPLTIRGPQGLDIEGIAYDSRQVRPGYLFVALHGRRREGRDFIDDAIHRGAVAVVGESGEVGRRGVATIRVEDSRRALAEIARAFYGEPSRSLQLIGITGTNGKSTTAFMCRDILKAAGRTPGLIGTIRYELGERSISASRTTPEAPDLQFMLDQMLRAGCKSAVMEVSSHGLDQKRVWGIDFDVGVFTNLTQDHLDYHKTLDRYFSAKTLLFRGLGQMEKAASAVINIDDPWGRQLADTGGFSARLITFGAHPGAMVRAGKIEIAPEGSVFDFTTPWGGGRARLKLLGRFNVSNALAAIGACGALGVDPTSIAAALSEIASVPGRLEPIRNGRGLSIFVDYAHTPDALANALRTLREVTDNRLLAVFGCGGNRDRGKRPIMGAAAAALADYSIVTSDNPRDEDPAAIIAAIAAGFGARKNYEMEQDREKAIAKALVLARPGDTVLIAGKGHETVQEFASTVAPFDDRDVVKRLLNKI